MRIPLSSIFPSLALAAVVLFTGCATVPSARTLTASRPSGPQKFLESLESAIRQENTLTASTVTIDHFPYLRVNRALFGLGALARTPQTQSDWLQRLNDLYLESVRKEIANLSGDNVQSLTDQFGAGRTRDDLYQHAAGASTALFHHDRENPAFFETVFARARPPDDYSETMRVLGLYPVFALFVKIGSAALYEEFREWHHEDWHDLESVGELTAFLPEKERTIDASQARAIIHNSPKSALGIPQLSEKDREQLFNFHAPHIYQDIAADFDRFGEIAWKDGRVSILTDKPTVYTYLTHGLYHDQPIIQLNYAIWYTRRDGAAPWYEHGALDGHTYRVSLTPGGDPFMVDTVNTCGCYHIFFPHPAHVQDVLNTSSATGPLVPDWLPDNYPAEPLAFQMASGWHQLKNIATDISAENPRTYRMIDYAVLESLPREDDQRESVFDRHGIMKDSYRIEPYFFFPSGIADIGFMRQRGRHPVRLAGKEYFTNPEIFNKNFILK